jgi:hypothetical protein
MRLDLLKKPEGTWCSFNEVCGIGDGVKTEFKAPFPASEARSVLVLRNFDTVQSDGRLVAMNDKDGKILKDEADGYRFETRNETELWIVFDRAPALDVRVSLSCLGRKEGDAFCILPMSTLLGKKIASLQPAIFRAPAKERANITSNDLQEAGRVTFMELVTDWTGITDMAGAPLVCNLDNKKTFLDQSDAMFFGIFVSNRSSAIRAERINAFSQDSSD